MEYLRSRGAFQPMGIWTTDLSPRSFSEVIGNRKVCDVLERFISSGQLPNVLLSGGHGTCKRTLAKLLVQNYLGDEVHKGCLAIDGAINRGKDVIACNNMKKVSDRPPSAEQNVLSYANTKITLRDGKKKIVMIYNFEDMTNEAQNALRRIIEMYEYNTRFVLICNSLDNVIEAIQSRCVPLYTQLLTATEAQQLLASLLTRAGRPPLDSDVQKVIVMLSLGDMKKLINYTQTISVGDCDLSTFHQVFNTPPLALLEEMILDSLHLETQHKVLDKVTFLLGQGYAYSDILEMLSKLLAYTEIVPDELRFKYLERLSYYFCYMAQQTHEVHLYALFSEWARLALVA